LKKNLNHDKLKQCIRIGYRKTFLSNWKQCDVFIDLYVNTLDVFIFFKTFIKTQKQENMLVCHIIMALIHNTLFFYIKKKSPSQKLRAKPSFLFQKFKYTHLL